MSKKKNDRNLSINQRLKTVVALVCKKDEIIESVLMERIGISSTFLLQSAYDKMRRKREMVIVK